MNHYTFISLGLLVLGIIAGFYDKTILLGVSANLICPKNAELICP